MREIGRRYAAITAITVTLLLAGFAAFAVARLELGANVPESPAPALFGVVLLIVDVALPIASSVVMVALGAIYGPALGGVLGAAGSLGALILGHELGRAGGRFVEDAGTDDDRRRAQRWLQRWGLIALLLSRPVPVLAETVAVLTGTARVPRHHVLLVGGIGAIPHAVAYATAGALARDLQAATVFAFVIAITLAVLAAAATHPRVSRDSTREVPQ